jgi:hypothetical protein
MKRIILAAAVAVVPTLAQAQGCEHDQYGGNCSDRNTHSRRASDWGADGGHSRARSSWKPREEGHSRAQSSRDRHSRANSERDR